MLLLGACWESDDKDKEETKTKTETKTETEAIDFKEGYGTKDHRSDRIWRNRGELDTGDAQSMHHQAERVVGAESREETENSQKELTGEQSGTTQENKKKKSKSKRKNNKKKNKNALKRNSYGDGGRGEGAESFVGGTPSPKDVLQTILSRTTAAYACCSECNSNLTFMAQLYAPIGDTQVDPRYLILMCCLNCLASTSEPSTTATPLKNTDEKQQYQKESPGRAVQRNPGRAVQQNNCWHIWRVQSQLQDCSSSNCNASTLFSSSRSDNTTTATMSGNNEAMKSFEISDDPVGDDELEALFALRDEGLSVPQPDHSDTTGRQRASTAQQPCKNSATPISTPFDEKAQAWIERHCKLERKPIYFVEEPDEIPGFANSKKSAHTDVTGFEQGVSASKNKNKNKNQSRSKNKSDEAPSSFQHETELLQRYIKEQESQGEDVKFIMQSLETPDSSSTETHPKARSNSRKSNKNADQLSAEEQYEKTPTNVANFIKFQRRIALFPNQCLRYAWGYEQPLWPGPVPGSFKGPPDCPGCGAPRFLEVQLIPTMISHFQLIGNRLNHEDNVKYSSSNCIKALRDMDWASILIYSCRDSCNASTQEWLFVVEEREEEEEDANGS